MCSTFASRAFGPLGVAVLLSACALDEPVGTNRLQQWLAPAAAVVEAGSAAQAVVFHSNQDGNAEIYLLTRDGSEIRLTDNAAEDIWPDISTNGRYVAFASRVGTNREIIVLDLKTGEQTNVSSSTADDNWPRFSPDGKQLAFHTNRDGNYEIYVVNLDGSALRRVTNNAALDQWPDWSPNGKQLAIRRAVDIWLVDAHGEEQNPLQLTFLPGSIDQMAVFSPNGKQLAFMSLREGYPSVFLMSVTGDTSEDPAINLTPKAAGDATNQWLSRAPAWSTNGRQIYFMSFRPSTSGDVELFVMNADGSGVTRLTSNPGEDGGPQAR